MARQTAQRAAPTKIPLFRPTIWRRQMHAVLECLVSEEIGPGDVARKLVREVASALRLAGGIALTDYGAALSAALRVVTAGAGSRSVLVPALAPLAYVQAVERLGLTPLLVDADPDTGSLSRESLQRLAAAEPQAAVACHGPGQPGVTDALQELGVPLVEDVTAVVMGLDPAAHAGSGTAAGGSAQAAEAKSALPVAGASGTVVVVALGGYGPLAAGGGALVLARGRKDQRLLGGEARDHGWGELPDVNAALALAQWQDRVSTHQRCTDLTALFRDAVARCRHRTLAPEAPAGHLFPVLVADGMRDVRRYAARHRIETGFAYDGCALTRIMAGATDGAADGAAAADAGDPAVAPVDSLGGAQELARRSLLFPLYPTLSDGAANRVAKVLATLP